MANVKKQKIYCDVVKMVLGEFSEDEIEDMASDGDLTDFYIDMIKQAGVDESDGVIINLALQYLMDCLYDENINNLDIVGKECLIWQYLELNDEVDFDLEDKRAYTLDELLNNANSN